MSHQHSPEEYLIDIILKYRSALTEDQYINLHQREEDRRHLNQLYAGLRTVNQKILDSKCYLQLGRYQQVQTMKFLADDTTQDQRLQMLAYILRSLTRPVLFVHGRATILYSPIEINEEGDTVKDDSQPTEDIAPAPLTGCEPEALSPEQLAAASKTIRSLIDKHRLFRRWQPKITLSQAEIISQMVAKGEISIGVASDEPQLAGITTAIVLKES